MPFRFGLLLAKVLPFLFFPPFLLLLGLRGGSLNLGRGLPFGRSLLAFLPLPACTIIILGALDSCCLCRRFFLIRLSLLSSFSIPSSSSISFCSSFSSSSSSASDAPLLGLASSTSSLPSSSGSTSPPADSLSSSDASSSSSSSPSSSASSSSASSSSPSASSFASVGFSCEDSSSLLLSGASYST